MIKEFYYIYVGENGIIESSIYIPGVPSVKKCRLIADKGKKLTKDNKNLKRKVIIPASEIELWYEVDEK